MVELKYIDHRPKTYYFKNRPAVSVQNGTIVKVTENEAEGLLKEKNGSTLMSWEKVKPKKSEVIDYGSRE